MVGAHRIVKMSTQQHSVCRAWAPARPFPASGIIGQESPLMNAPSYPAHAHTPALVLFLSLSNNLHQHTDFCSHERFRRGQPRTVPALNQI